MSAMVIGDVVGSRSAVDRASLHHRLTAALVEAAARWGGDLRVTVGDEYQGTFDTLGAATAAALDVRLALLPSYDVRHGLGRGTATVLDHDRAIEDGPGWWQARAAIDAVKDLAGTAGTRSARTGFRSDEPGAPAVEAALLARDELVGRLDERSLSVLRGLMQGRTQRELADDEGVSASAVSQRVRRDGLGVVVTTSRWLASLR